MLADRKISYKLPPTTITDKLISQEARRSKALEEQKRRRAQRVDSSRQLDLFADLNLGASDEEDGNAETSPGVSLASVAPYASMLSQDATASSSGAQPPQFEVRESYNDFKKPKKKRRNKNKTNKWSDKCMYAELLEMASDDPWPLDDDNDGLPKDLESGWVAVGPVPVGKRCLAVTHQSSGVAGVVPNTTLRSRLLGKVLIQRFPSILPPLTILDCILDSNWRKNGILHILDVVKWKGQDVGDCETPFRLWWRDTRLAELTQPALPIIQPTAISVAQSMEQPCYHFPYPKTFLPVPYNTDTTLSTLFKQVIPSARSSRSVTVEIPSFQLSPSEGIMDVDTSSYRVPTNVVSVSTNVPSDGLLLYVVEASYEAGTSPLSSWIPIIGYENRTSGDIQPASATSEGPLDLFQRLVERRLSRGKTIAASHDASMDMDV